jgi:VanZ family protein
MTDFRGNRSFAWTTLPAILWPVLIFLASSIPSAEMPHSILFSYDKALHAGVFGIFCFLVYRAFVLRTPPLSQRKAMMYSLLATILYGATDEIHQMFVPGRSSEILDLVADAVGAGICLLIIYIIHRKRRTSSVR